MSDASYSSALCAHACDRIYTANAVHLRKRIKEDEIPYFYHFFLYQGRMASLEKASRRTFSLGSLTPDKRPDGNEVEKTYYLFVTFSPYPYAFLFPSF
jgi:hypothetical protein